MFGLLGDLETTTTRFIPRARPVPVLASARIQRWAQLLGAYDYVIAYKPGDQLANADSLSRLIHFLVAFVAVAVRATTLTPVSKLFTSPRLANSHLKFSSLQKQECKNKVGR